MSAALTESTVEAADLARLQAIGWAVKHGPEIAPDGLFSERADYGEAVLAQRLRPVAQDTVEHFERHRRRQRGDRLDGARERARAAARARLFSPPRVRAQCDDDKGAIKVVMTGSASDPADWQPYIRNRPRRQPLNRSIRWPDDKG